MGRKSFLSVIMSFIFLVSCGLQEDKNYSYILIFNPEKSDVKEMRLIRDSVLVQVYSEDSMFISTYASGIPLEFRFFKNGAQFWERRYRSNDFGEILKFDSILTFSKTDTAFIYKSARSIYPLVQTYSFADCLYEIKKEGEEYMSIKQSQVDTTYKEIYYYDKDYHPYRYVNTWQNNTYVYEKRKE